MQMEAIQRMDPAGRHALRGFSASLAAGTVVATILGNRRALLSFSPSQLASLRVSKPSRNTIAIAVFVGVFRFVERFQRNRKHRDNTTAAESDAVKKALVVASASSMACMEPGSRTPLLALVSTNAVSMWFKAFIAKHPELAMLKPLDLMVFMMSSGWILYSGFFHPDSYEPAHMKLIMKYSITTPQVAEYLQNKYKQGLNPTPCEARHPGRECGEFFFNTFVWQTIAVGLRLYFPVHFTTWLLALRHRAVRSKPLMEQLEMLATRVVRSALYFIVFILVGWTTPCYTNAIGGRSLWWRKFQFLVGGSLPAMALLFESPSRRRPIGVILSSYAFVSMGTVLSENKAFHWLKQGSAARKVLDVVVFSVAVASTLEGLAEGNAVLQRMMYGRAPPPPAPKVLSEEEEEEEAEEILISL